MRLLLDEVGNIEATGAHTYSNKCGERRPGTIQHALLAVPGPLTSASLIAQLRSVSTTIDSRSAILDAAERLFAQQGFAATTIKQIGREAQLNPALLYYYFDSKETLYHEVLARGLQGFVSTGMRRLEGEADPQQAIRTLVAVQVEVLAANPNLPALLIRELIDHQAAHARDEITHLATTLFRRLCDAIEQGQRSGTFRRDFDPKFGAISTIAQVAYLFIARPLVGIILGHGPAGPPAEVLRQFAEHAGDFAITALSARSASTPSSPSGPR